MEWYRLYKESSDGLTKDEFDKLFYDYVDAVDEYYWQEGYKSKTANMLKLKMKEFIDTVKSNVSSDYKHDDPKWEEHVSMVIIELDDIIGDGNDDWIERKKRQLWYDFIAYKSLPGENTNESSEEPVDLKKLLKLNGVTKLPSGSQIKPNRISWSKRGGYAGRKTLDQMREVLEDAGWKKGEWKPDGSPDGSWVSNSDSYTSPDGKIVMSYYSCYGATSRDNSYGFTFKLAESQMNESDELDDWNDGVPKVYKYHSDDTISPKEFASIVRSTEHTVEDIFIQNSDFYENADDPWGEFVNDMCQGKSPEEALELDYYMNSSAREQLPDDIAKYVYANDFDAMQWLRGIFERLMPICKDPVNESEIKGTGRVDFDDDLVAVYTPDGKLEYKGLFDDCPYKDDDMRYDKTTMTYRIEGPNGDYRTMAKLAESCRESSRFGFNIGDKVELKSDVEPNRFSGRGVVPAGTVGEVVAIDKPMRGVIKVKIEDGTVVSVPERKLKFAGTDNEPWEKYKVPAKPKPSLKEILDKHGPEEIYNEPPPADGSPKWTGD